MTRLGPAAALALVSACAAQPAPRPTASPRSAPAPAPAAVPVLPKGGLRLVYEVDFAHAWESRGREAMLARTVDVLGARVRDLFKDGGVRASGGGIEVLLPGGEPSSLETYRRLASRRGLFRVLRVDDGSAFMATVAERVRAEAFEGVTAEIDRWTEPRGGAAHVDPFLAAPERKPLVAALDRVVRAIPLPADRELFLDCGPGGCRSYLAIRSGGIDSSDVAAAKVEAHGRMGLPEIVIRLTGEGRRKLADLTGAIGRKMVVAIDAEVVMAPVVASPTSGGEIHMALDPATARTETKDLPALLRSGALPAPLALMKEEMVPAPPVASPTPP